MKDIKLVGLLNLIILGIAIVGGVLGVVIDGDNIPDSASSLISNFVYGFVLFVIWFMINANIGGKESKIKSDAFIISMPVKKFDIVKSRYLTMIIYILGSLVIMYLTSNISKLLFSNLPGNPLELGGIAIILNIMIIYLSLYLPFQYYDLKSSQMFSGIFYMLVILSPNLIRKFNINIGNLKFLEKIMNLNSNIVGLILLAVGLTLYLISLFISKGIYEAKEF